MPPMTFPVEKIKKPKKTRAQRVDGIVKKLKKKISEEEKSTNTSPKYANEYRLQCAIATWFTVNYPNANWSSRPMGADWGPRLGVFLKQKGVKANEADIVIYDARGGYFGGQIELKHPQLDPKKLKIPEEQMRFLDVMRTQCNHFAVYMNSLAEFQSLIRWYYSLDPTPVPPKKTEWKFNVDKRTPLVPSLSTGKPKNKKEHSAKPVIQPTRKDMVVEIIDVDAEEDNEIALSPDDILDLTIVPRS